MTQSTAPFNSAAQDFPQSYILTSALGYIWDVPTLEWVKSTGGGGGGGAVTVADGADVTQGAVADAAWVSGSGTVISLLKKIASAGGSAVSIADGADVAEGTTTDVAWTSGAGTVVGILKKLVSVLGSPFQAGGSIGNTAFSVNNSTGASAVNIQDGGNSITVDGSVTVNTGLTDTQLRASAVPVSNASLPLPTGAATEATLARINTQGQKAMAASTPVVIASDQSTINVSAAEASVLFKGRACTFRTPGRAGTTGQKIMSLHNATGSAVKVKVTYVCVDLYQTVIKAVTVAPPVVRLWKVTVLPTNGTAMTKVQLGGTSTSSSSVTVLCDASADGTSSASALTATLPAATIVTQEFAPRLITAVGYEVADRMEFLVGSYITLNALEGVVLFLDYTAATQNPITDMWVAAVEWTEV